MGVINNTDFLELSLSLGWFHETKGRYENHWIQTICRTLLRKKCPNTEFFLVRIKENTDQKKLRIRTLFTQGIPKYPFIFIVFTVGIYLLKVNNRITKTRCKTCSKLTIKTPERRQWRRHWLCYGVFFVNFEHISHFVIVLLLLTSNI